MRWLANERPGFCDTPSVKTAVYAAGIAALLAGGLWTAVPTAPAATPVPVAVAAPAVPAVPAVVPAPVTAPAAPATTTAKPAAKTTSRAASTTTNHTAAKKTTAAAKATTPAYLDPHQSTDDPWVAGQRQWCLEGHDGPVPPSQC